jgi:transposase
MLTDDLDVVIGVDTHKDTHTAAVLSPTGAVLDQLTVPADPRGYRRLIAFGEAHGAIRAWGIEGTGSFGAGLTAALLARREQVIEVDRPKRPARRAGAKSDEIDAVRAAREVLSGDRAGEPRCRGRREAIRVLLTTRAQAIEFRTRAISALHALVVSAPVSLRERLRGLTLGQLLDTCVGLRGSARQSAEEFATTMALRSTARRALACEHEAAELEAQIHALVCQVAPALLGQVGIGPVVAAQVIVSWSHRGRPGLVGPNRPPPAQPQWRPPAQPGPAHRGHGPDAPRRRHQGLRQPSTGRGQEHPGDQAVLEALRRPAAVPPARGAPTGP